MRTATISITLPHIVRTCEHFTCLLLLYNVNVGQSFASVHDHNALRKGEKTQYTQEGGGAIAKHTWLFTMLCDLRRRCSYLLLFGINFWWSRSENICLHTANECCERGFSLLPPCCKLVNQLLRAAFQIIITVNVDAKRQKNRQGGAYGAREIYEMP